MGGLGTGNLLGASAVGTANVAMAAFTALDVSTIRHSGIADDFRIDTTSSTGMLSTNGTTSISSSASLLILSDG